VRIHLDTDLGTSVDDLAALLMVLGWPGVELAGITTCIDPGGQRAGYVAHVLEQAGRGEVPVAAGAEISLTTRRLPGELATGPAYWPEPVAPVPAPAGSALALLAASIDAGATAVAIGPATNLALLGVERPATLARAEVVMMAGWFDAGTGADAGLPPWGPARDWNVQCDTRAAEVVASGAGRLTLVPLSLTRRVHLRRRDLPRLEAAGPLGQLLARQARVQAEQRATPDLALEHSGLPGDLLAFHHDPLTVAVALKWPGVTVAERRLTPVTEAGILHFAGCSEGDDRPEHGRPVAVAVDVDAPAFAERWLAAVVAVTGPDQKR